MGIFNALFPKLHRKMADALEIRRLRHRPPFVYRGFVTRRGDVRIETDAEFLVRLRLAREEVDPNQRRCAAGTATDTGMETYSIVTDGMGGYQVRVNRADDAPSYVAVTFPTWGQARRWIDERLEVGRSRSIPREWPSGH